MDVVTVFYALLAYCMVLTVIVIYGMTQTPLKFFIKAKLLNQKILFKKIKGLNVMRFEVAKDRTSGSMRSRSGYYFKTPNSGFLLQPGNIPCFLMPASSNRSVGFELLEMVQALESKYKTRIDDFFGLQKLLARFNQEHPDKALKLPANVSVKPHDLDALFPQNMNVDDEEALIGLEKHKARLNNPLSIQHAIMIFIILIGLGVGVFLISKTFGGQCPSCTCILDAAKNITTTSGVIVGG